MNSLDVHMKMLKETSELDPLYKFLDPGFIGDLYSPLVGGATPSAELRVESTADVSA